MGAFGLSRKFKSYLKPLELLLSSVMQTVNFKTYWFKLAPIINIL